MDGFDHTLLETKSRKEQSKVDLNLIEMANPSVLRIDHDDELVFSELSTSVCLLLRCGVWWFDER